MNKRGITALELISAIIILIIFIGFLCSPWAVDREITTSVPQEEENNIINYQGTPARATAFASHSMEQLASDISKATRGKKILKVDYTTSFGTNQAVVIYSEK